MGELAFEDSIIQYAQRRGWMVRKMRYRGRRGCPDCWFFRRGEVLLVEFKAPLKTERLLQRREHARYLDHGFAVVAHPDRERMEALLA